MDTSDFKTIVSGIITLSDEQTSAIGARLMEVAHEPNLIRKDYFNDNEVIILDSDTDDDAEYGVTENKALVLAMKHDDLEPANENVDPMPSQSGNSQLSNLIPNKQEEIATQIKWEESCATATPWKFEISEVISLADDEDSKCTIKDNISEISIGELIPAASLCEPKFDADNNEKELEDDSNGFTMENGSESDNDDEMDDETEMKLISLIESDQEDTVPSNSSESTTEAPADTLHMLMHYDCPVCGESCGNIKKWRAHTNMQHNFQSIESLNVQTVINKSGQLCYQCKVCARKFELIQGFAVISRHQYTHFPFPLYVKCRLCEYRAKRSSCLRKHITEKHAKICRSYIRRKREIYDNHIEQRCPVCNKLAKNMEHGRRHYKRHDIDEFFKKISEFTYECDKCHKRFKSEYKRAHYTTHQPYKCFKCKLCDRYECQKHSDMVAHIRHTHFGIKKVYKCFYCELDFETARARFFHVKENHRIREPKCSVCQCVFRTSGLLLKHVRDENHQTMK